MTLRVEALPARYGDCLFITFGKTRDLMTRLLVDGGPSGVFEASLKPRLARESTDEVPLRLDAIMVSHIDEDHIFGIIRLLEAMRDADDQHRPRPYRPVWLLHNGFDAILGAGEGTAARSVGGPAALASVGGGGATPIGSNHHPVATAVLQSYGQAITLGSLAAMLHVTRNPPDQTLLTSDRTLMTLGDATLRILAPLDAQVEDFRKEWAKKVETPNPTASLASYVDRSVPNLASIVALLKYEERTVLLTGDARGDLILKACELAELMPEGGNLKVDVLKVPHHGSDRDLALDFFQRIRADHYIISANGNFGNPDRASLEMLETANADRDIEVYLTMSAASCDVEHQRWRSSKPADQQFVAAKHAIAPIIERWKKPVSRIKVHDGAPIDIKFPPA